MVEITKIDNQLYKAIYIEKDKNKYNEIWNKIRNNKEILKEATKVKRNKWDSGDIVNGLTISDSILIHYEDVDYDVYQELINQIYTNQDIARIVLDGASNGGYSFLLMSLWNHNLKLTEIQKAFAVNEAMNKIGTIYWKYQQDLFSQKLDDMGINDKNTVIINFGGSVNPIGQKAGTQHINYILSSLDSKQAHGTGCYDIRYCILKNPNWTLEEKQKLIMDFWYDEENYEETLEEWEWGIINDYANYQDSTTEFIDKSYLYEYSYEELLNFYNDKKTTDRIWVEIEFCKLMHQLRPVNREKDYKSKKKELS